MPKRYALTSIALNATSGNNFEVDLPAGAQFVGSYVRHEPNISPLVLSQPGGRPGRTAPVPYLLMQYDPDEQGKIKRYFSLVFSGNGFATDHEVKHVATFVVDMEVLVLFELVHAAPAAALEMT